MLSRYNRIFAKKHDLSRSKYRCPFAGWRINAPDKCGLGLARPSWLRWTLSSVASTKYPIFVSLIIVMDCKCKWIVNGYQSSSSLVTILVQLSQVLSFVTTIELGQSFVLVIAILVSTLTLVNTYRYISFDSAFVRTLENTQSAQDPFSPENSWIFF